MPLSDPTSLPFATAASKGENLGSPQTRSLIKNCGVWELLSP